MSTVIQYFVLFFICNHPLPVAKKVTLIYPSVIHTVKSICVSHNSGSDLSVVYSIYHTAVKFDPYCNLNSRPIQNYNL